MPELFFPHLSQAKGLLPVIRAELIAAAAHHSLPLNVSLDLLPIVEDGLFGYELLPSRESQTYLTIGCDNRSAPMLRRSLYCAAAPSALRLATVNGRFLSQGDLEAWHRIQQHDENFPDWTAAAEAVWDELVAMFPASPRRIVEIRDALHQNLDDGLAIAHSHLGRFDPHIDFCGVPDEAQYGFVLTGENGERGQLVARPPGRWALRWRSSAGALCEEWAATPAGFDTAGAWARAAMRSDEAGVPAALLAPASSGASSQRPKSLG